MSTASIARVFHSYQAKQQRWADALGMSPPDLLLALLTLIALMVFICAV